MKKKLIDIDSEFDAFETFFDETKIAQITGIKNRGLNPEWHRANNQRRLDDPDYDKKVAAKISAAYSTPEGKAKQSAKSRPHTEEAKEKIRQANLGLKKSPELCAKLSVKKQGNQNRIKPIVTPLGVFPSRKLAAEAYIASGKLNAMKWIEKWLKIDPTNFYYISKEEYIILTGKDI